MLNAVATYDNTELYNYVCMDLLCLLDFFMYMTIRKEIILFLVDLGKIYSNVKNTYFSL